ncbi:hypothetical protein LT493_33825 [Streptomyces tricolor]|nr:hypothetical protein [Streptomyces tricolor]
MFRRRVEGPGDTSGKDGSKPAAKALSAAELKKLIIAQGDVPGHKVGAVEGGIPDKSKVTSEDAKCEPVLRAFTGIAPGDPAAHTDRMATEEKKKGPPRTTPPPLDDLEAASSRTRSTSPMDLDVTVVTWPRTTGDGAEAGPEVGLRSVRPARAASSEQGRREGQVRQRSPASPPARVTSPVAFTAVNDAGKDRRAAAARRGRATREHPSFVYTTINIGAMMTKKAYTVSAPGREGAGRQAEVTVVRSARGRSSCSGQLGPPGVRQGPQAAAGSW